MTLHRFSGAVALVTGAGAGIGKAVALRLAAEGAAIGIASRTEGSAASVADECRALGVRAAYSIVDFADQNAAARAYRELSDELGPASVLVNNVAAGLQAPFLESTDDHYQAVFEVNFFAAVRLTRLALPAMLERGTGSVVNVSSPQGLIGWPNHGAYSASKGALMSWTRQLANEFAFSGVRFNSILPGAVMTPLQEARIAAEGDGFIERSVNLHIIPRMQQPEEVAAGVAFLASDDASFMTGATLDDSGGALVKAHWYR